MITVLKKIITILKNIDKNYDNNKKNSFFLT